MLYVTEIHALNLPCSLETCGDWHTSALQWTNPHIRESEGSLFGDYGIEHNKKIPEHTERYNVANHIRALLDLLEIGFFTVAQGMNNDFICNSKYDNEIFEKVYMMRYLPNWNEISFFMTKEYYMKWVNFLDSKTERYHIANHIRALLDLLEIDYFTVAQDTDNEFICNSKYNNEVFEKIYTMMDLPNWNEINSFMTKEFCMKWVNFLASKTENKGSQEL